MSLDWSEVGIEGAATGAYNCSGTTAAGATAT